ncbi:MAG: hypothetical protein JNK05_21840 [Myxococcales bacterium]|nr:hypothetical protein [Myxococcales bacterium]
MRRTIVTSLAALALLGCPSRPSNPDATADVTLAPIDTGVDALDRDANDVVAPDAADVTDSGVANDADASAPDGSDGAAEGGRPDVAPRCDPDAGTGDGGCVLCPVNSAGFLNQCTGASCARFDNSRCGRLLPDGGLPLLP